MVDHLPDVRNMVGNIVLLTSVIRSVKRYLIEQFPLWK